MKETLNQDPAEHVKDVMSQLDHRLVLTLGREESFHKQEEVVLCDPVVRTSRSVINGLEQVWERGK